VVDRRQRGAPGRRWRSQHPHWQVGEHVHCGPGALVAGRRVDHARRWAADCLRLCDGLNIFPFLAYFGAGACNNKRRRAARARLGCATAGHETSRPHFRLTALGRRGEGASHIGLLPNADRRRPSTLNATRHSPQGRSDPHRFRAAHREFACGRCMDGVSTCVLAATVCASRPLGQRNFV